MKKLLESICLTGIFLVVFIWVIAATESSGTYASSDTDSINNTYELEDIEQKYYDDAVPVITKIMPTKIFVYGEELLFDEEIYDVYIDEISEESLYSGWKYNFVILNDCNGNMDINEDELNLLKDLAEEKHYNIIYIGTRQIEQFKKLEFVDENTYIDENFMYFGSNQEEDETSYGQDISEICFFELDLNELNDCINEFEDPESGLVYFISREVDAWED